MFGRGCQRGRTACTEDRAVRMRRVDLNRIAQFRGARVLRAGDIYCILIPADNFLLTH